MNMLFNCGHVILAKLLREGDRVVYNPNTSDESWGYVPEREKARIGVTGTVTGFEAQNVWVGDLERRQRSGLYRTRGAPRVEWDDGSEGKPSIYDISWWPWEKGASASGEGLDLVGGILRVQNYNKEIMEKRQSQRPTSDEFDHDHTFVQPLPDIGLLVGDRVCLREDVKIEGAIRQIDWYNYGKTRDDGGPMPILDVSLPTGYSQRWEVGEVEVVSRGPLYRWLKGLPLKFYFQEDAAAFFLGIGKAKEVPNKDGYYIWDLEEAKQAVIEGKADCVLTRIPLRLDEDVRKYLAIGTT